jgi:phage baseplate assembly protein W
MAKNRSRSSNFISRGYKDFSISFKSNPGTGDFATVKDDEAIKQAVRNIVLTSKGEKLFQPQFGSQIRGLLFENYNPFNSQAIVDEITIALLNFEPRIKVISIELDDDNYDVNALNVTMTYLITGQPLVKSLNFILTKA